MGEFCVAGFHSRLPIHKEQKVVAIVCRVVDDPVDNYPCYLDGKLSPIAMPVIGLMGDYGVLDDWEESETTKLFEQYTGMDFGKMSDSLIRCSKYDKANQFPKVFRLFDKMGIYVEDKPKRYRYTIIYEHYSIYKKMTYDIKTVREWLLMSDEFLRMFYKLYPDWTPTKESDGYPNVFSELRRPIDPYKDIMFEDITISYIRTKIAEGEKLEKIVLPGALDEVKEKLKKYDTPEWKEMDSLYAKYRKTKVPYMMSNVSLSGFMYLYFMGKYDIRNAIDDIIDWVSFVQTLDYCSGHFYYSVSAGQDWHHDENYIKFNKELLQEMITILDSYEKYDEDDDYDEDDSIDEDND